MKFFKGLFSSRRTKELQALHGVQEIGRALSQFLSVELFKRCVLLAEARFTEIDDSDALGAHVKLTCTGEGPNEKSQANLSQRDRERAEALATEIMSTNAKGFYWHPIDDMQRYVLSLPDTLASIKSLALTAGRQAALTHLAASADISRSLEFPVIDTAYVEATTLPILLFVIEQEPDNVILLTDLAQTYFSLGRLDAGYATAVDATELDPGNAEAWRLLGNAYVGYNDDFEARRCFERAIALDPNSIGAQHALQLLGG